MAAALEVYGTQGYARGTVSTICAAAGLSRRQFYELFDSREDLLIAVYDMIHAQARTAVLAAFARADPAASLQDRVRPAIAAFFDSVATDPRRMRIAFVEIGGVSARVEAHRVRSRAEWTTFFGAAAAEIGGLRDSPFGFDYEAAAFIGALTEAGHLWASSTERPDRDEVIDMLLAVIVALATRRSTAEPA
ncbi:MAG: TetR family transcriptional regulator [Gordonia sp.]|uniref:TetR/AcrR family transcriptional regulator n=1 Tax=Gordonia sp. (in: high G+C Gram-positive bacteria) TaxID=84139 RepID=UPI000C5C55E4|nr:TetR/AcrR family transcriptional regulator [Gordonia sp. (in: high G+C Gram-positive bacteria)]MAU83752.1 TetR family transcriptional regulator [Gordonia sp. (in: high G+C Gram-positive bacteria)]